ncbi:MAG TPA: TonB-dependent receptor [Rhizomicrobium sp.]|nr:TonB-dependent receptor [Rhizomicrobium sp.]
MQTRDARHRAIVDLRHCALGFASTTAIALSLLSGTAVPAAAQTAPDSNQQASGGIETVVVTARKREEQLINVPVAASTMNTETLDRYASTDLTAIGNQMPGVNLARTGGGTSGASLSIRGVGNLAIDYGNEQPVAIVIDGMQLTRGHVLDIGMFDVQQVEVLKGPQALFFGKNSPAGVVSIDTVNPGDTFEGYARVGYEVATEMPFVEGAVSIPITDTLSVRFAGRYQDMLGGYVTNVAKPLADPFPGEDTFTLPGAADHQRPGIRNLIGRFTAVWKPVENFDATLKVLGAEYHDNGSALASEAVGCFPGNNHPSVVDLLAPAIQFHPYGDCKMDGHTSIGNAPPEILSNFAGAPTNGKPFDKTDTLLTTLTMNYTFSNITLTSVTGYYHATQSGFDNFDWTVYAQALDAQKDNNASFTQEFRASSDYDGPLNFTVGAFYEYDHRPFFNTDKIFPLGPYPVPGPNAGIYNTLLMQADNRGVSYSAFGQVNWKILENLELAAGARWSHDTKVTDIGNTFNYLSLFIPDAFNPFSPAGRVFHPRVSENNLSPEVTLTWHPEENWTVYGAYRTGYLAGGASNPGNVSNYDSLCAATAGCTDPDSLLKFRDERVTGGEGGTKAVLLDGKLSGDLTLYWYQYSNLQVTTFDSATTSFFTKNAGGARNRGVELQAAYQATDALAVHGFVEYSDLSFTSYIGAPCNADQGCSSQDLSGRIYGGPPLEFNLGATYNTPLDIGWNLGLAGDIYVHSRAPKLNSDPLVPGSEPYTLLNASARLTDPQGVWEVAVIGTNLTNERYFTVGAGKPLGLPGEYDAVDPLPAQVTFQVTRRF